MALRVPASLFALVLLACGGRTRGGAPDGAQETSQPEPEPDVPQLDPPAAGPLIKVSLSESSACTLRRDGRVACFELEQGYESSTVPVAGSFRDVAGDARAGAALREDGSVATWGDLAPRFPSGPLQQVAFDREAACGIRTDRSIACGGTTEADGTSLTGEYQQLLVAGDGGVCGLSTDGALRCKTSPAWEIEPPVDALPPLRQVAIDPTGTVGGCGIDLAGALHCWGYYCPIAGTFAYVSVGYLNACATTTEGELRCWNYRLAQEDCSAAVSAIKLPPPPSGTFTQVASALSKTCAIETGGGSVQCW